MTSYADLAKMAAVQISPQVQTAIRVRSFALALWQEAVRAVQGCSCAGADLRFEPLYDRDGFSLGHRDREVRVVREHDHVRVLVVRGASHLSFFWKERYESPAPEDAQKEAEALLCQVLTLLLLPF